MTDTIEFRQIPGKDYSYQAEADNLPAGVTATILRRSQHLPYEARFTTPEDGRAVCFDQLDAAENWVNLMAGRHIASAAWRLRRSSAIDTARILDRMGTAPRGDSALDHGRTTLMLALNTLVADAGNLTIREVEDEPLTITVADGTIFHTWVEWASTALEEPKD